MRALIRLLVSGREHHSPSKFSNLCPALSFALPTHAPYSGGAVFREAAPRSVDISVPLCQACRFTSLSLSFLICQVGTILSWTQEQRLI